MIPLRYLSALIFPPEDWLMGIFKAYFDNSGDENDSNIISCSLGGFVGTIEDWDYFETEWQNTLCDKVPYIHMKDFNQYIWPFDKYKNDKDSRINLLESLIKVIKDSNLKGFTSSIYVEDLKRINKHKRSEQQLDAYAINLYTCMRFISNIWPGVVIEVNLDHFRGIYNKIPKTMNYIDRDKLHHNFNSFLKISPLCKALGYQEVIPIQAADILAYETFKENKTIVEVMNGKSHFNDNDYIIKDGIKWFPRRGLYQNLLKNIDIKSNFEWKEIQLHLLSAGGYLYIESDNAGVRL
jgi:hypothetical protein